LESLKALENFAKRQWQFGIWAKIAIDECKMF